MKKYILLAIIALAVFISCKKETENYTSAPLSDYFPLQTGKYITYQLDSLVYYNFGTRDSVASYQVKYQIDSLITDNLGRPAYRVFRFIRRQTNEAWIPQETLMMVNTSNTVELMENNLRYVKLAFPIKDGFSWEGNIYINPHSFDTELSYLDGWDYVYDSVGKPSAVGNFSLDNTLTVSQANEIFGILGVDTSYSQQNYAEEKYAKGIGLVYRKFYHYLHQGDPTGGYVDDGSYGITMTMIDHN